MVAIFPQIDRARDLVGVFFVRRDAAVQIVQGAGRTGRRSCRSRDSCRPPRSPDLGTVAWSAAGGKDPFWPGGILHSKDAKVSLHVEAGGADAA
jgi:hypothetical protein